MSSCQRVLGRECMEARDGCSIVLAGRSTEARQVRSVVGAAGNLAPRQQPARQHTIEGGTQCCERGENGRLWPARDNGVLRLHVSDGMDICRAANRLDANLGKAYVSHVSRLYEVGYCLRQRTVIPPSTR